MTKKIENEFKLDFLFSDVNNVPGWLFFLSG